MTVRIEFMGCLIDNLSMEETCATCPPGITCQSGERSTQAAAREAAHKPDKTSKLNFGCGNRFADGWCNIDFAGHGDKVRSANLLRGFPFPNGTFDVVYSSHVLEHFAPEEGAFLLRESYRVLRPGGIVRIVVPDLEDTCREYLRILQLDDACERKEDYYRWILVELLDQMVRTRPRGLMGPLMDRAASGGDREFADYIRYRAGIEAPGIAVRSPLMVRLRKLKRGRIASRLRSRLLTSYLKGVALLVPASLRQMVMSQTTIGEKHRWMYDRYGLSLAMRDTGFANVRFNSHAQSAIPGFAEDFLDTNPDGSPYKSCSLYCEATRP